MKKLKKRNSVNMKNKRIVPGFSLKNLGTILLLPYIITFILGNSNTRQSKEAYAETSKQLAESQFVVINETNFGTESIPLEIYVADLLSRTLDSEYHRETRKAQAILIRTNLLAEKDGEGKIQVKDEAYGSQIISDENWNAVKQCAGICLSADNHIVSAPYFLVSNGVSRSGPEVLGKDYNYLISIPCSRDFQSKDYCHNIVYSNQELDSSWKQMEEYKIKEKQSENFTDLQTQKDADFILERDCAGYVLLVKRFGKTVSGEEFRSSLGLPSACFYIERNKNETMITTKGSGHGFGMSQYGANELAKQGKDYIEILETFFPNITITKIE